MRYVLDHDLHNHSFISPCSRDDRQTKQAIFAYALTNGYRLVALTDHGWDTKVDDKGAPGWGGNDMERLRSNLPLPQAKRCRFLMGCEIDMNRHGVFGLSAEERERFDFIIASESHLNLTHFTIDPAQVGSDAASRKAYYEKRLHTLLDMDDLPFYKMGLAHFTTGNICNAELHRCISLFSDAELAAVFEKVKARGMGVELNFVPRAANAEDLDIILRPHRIAKQVGCKFYFGGDAHHPERFGERRAEFETIVDLLDLKESDKWEFIPRMIAENAQ